MNAFMKRVGRRLFFPGFDIHTRARASLCRFWKTGPRRVLDAGLGNGYFSYLAWKSGARVDAVGFEAESIDKAKTFFSSQSNNGEINFILANLYDLDYSAETFDEIICYEVLEHLMQDQEMVCRFSKWLKPRGLFASLCTEQVTSIQCKYYPFNDRRRMARSSWL